MAKLSALKGVSVGEESENAAQMPAEPDAAHFDHGWQKRLRAMRDATLLQGILISSVFTPQHATTLRFSLQVAVFATLDSN